MNEDDLVARKDALLESVLPNVTFDGWSLTAMRAGAKALKLDETESFQLFPGGAGEAALWLDDWADRRMLDALESRDLAAMKVRERVGAAVMARLAVLAPYREAVRRAIALKLSPFGAARAAQIVYRTVDAIWYAAGDQATDFNFYTKRSLLAAVYAPTMLYWLNDGSEGATETEAFLQRRLAQVMKLPGLTGKLRKTAERVAAPFAFLRPRA
ncbi:MAG TPA: COQ9 family protein [Aliidongia sp.]|nr:COQ9 family protein [Aliidongia sp.]